MSEPKRILSLEEVEVKIQQHQQESMEMVQILREFRRQRRATQEAKRRRGNRHDRLFNNRRIAQATVQDAPPLSSSQHLPDAVQEETEIARATYRRLRIQLADLVAHRQEILHRDPHAYFMAQRAAQAARLSQHLHDIPDRLDRCPPAVEADVAPAAAAPQEHCVFDPPIHWLGPSALAPPEVVINDPLWTMVRPPAVPLLPPPPSRRPALPTNPFDVPPILLEDLRALVARMPPPEEEPRDRRPYHCDGSDQDHHNQEFPSASLLFLKTDPNQPNPPSPQPKKRDLDSILVSVWENPSSLSSTSLPDAVDERPMKRSALVHHHVPQQETTATIPPPPDCLQHHHHHTGGGEDNDDTDHPFDNDDEDFVDTKAPSTTTDEEDKNSRKRPVVSGIHLQDNLVETKARHSPSPSKGLEDIPSVCSSPLFLVTARNEEENEQTYHSCPPFVSNANAMVTPGGDVDDLVPDDMNHLFDDKVSNEDLLVDGTVAKDDHDTQSSRVSLLIPLWHFTLYLLPMYAIYTTLQGMTSDPKRIVDYFAVNSHCPLVSHTLLPFCQGSLSNNNDHHHHYMYGDYDTYCHAEDSYLKLILGDMQFRTASQDSWSLFLKTFQDSWRAFLLYLVLLPTLTALPYACVVWFLRHVENLVVTTTPPMNNNNHNKERRNFRQPVARFLNGILYSAFEFPFGVLRNVCQWSWWGLVTMPYSYSSSIRRAMRCGEGDSNSTAADTNTMMTSSSMSSLWTKGWMSMYEVIVTMTFTSLLCRVVRLVNHHHHHYHANDTHPKMRTGGMMGIIFWVWLPGIMLGTITGMIRTWRRWRLRCEQRQAMALLE